MAEKTQIESCASYGAGRREKLSDISTHRPGQLLFRGLLLQRLLLEGLLSGGGGRQVLWAEAKALQKLENFVIFLLELGNQVSPFSSFGRKLHAKQQQPQKKNKKKLTVYYTDVTQNASGNDLNPDLQERLQLSKRGLHEVLLSLGEGPDAAGQQLLSGGVELGKLVQQLGVESLVVVTCHLQLVLNAAVFEALGTLLAVVVVQQLVKALLDEFVRPGEHGQELGERVDDQGLCALFLFREERKSVEGQRSGVRPES